MQHIHIDYAGIEQFQVLVIIDSHSKWIEAIPLRSATSATTIDALFCQFWIARGDSQ